MVRMQCKLRFTGMAQPGGVSQRAWATVKRASLAEGAAWWHQQVLPKHFETPARTRYGYRPRSAPYAAWKARTGKPDIEYHKDTRHAALAKPTIVARPGRAIVIMQVPAYAGIRRKAGANRPDLAQEITAVRPDDQFAIAIVVRRGILRRLAEVRGETTRSIG